MMYLYSTRCTFSNLDPTHFGSKRVTHTSPTPGNDMEITNSDFGTHNNMDDNFNNQRPGTFLVLFFCKSFIE